MKVYTVFERWNMNALEHDINVFDSREKAEEYAEMRAQDACRSIENSTIRYAGDEECYTGCDMFVDGDSDDWWEVYIEEKEMR